jgi:hypothetical protein
MNIFKKTLVLWLFFPFMGMAGEAICTIEIEDINASSKSSNRMIWKVVESFYFKNSPNALTDMQSKNFKLSGNKYLCTLSFLDLKIGTALSCTDNYSYVQSDQSGFKIDRSENNLTFRNGVSHFSLNAVCVSKA